MQIAKAAALLTASSLIGRGAVVIGGILIARFHGADAFALFVFVHITATSASNIAMLGMMNGLPRFLARMNADSSPAAFTQVIMAFATVCSGLGLTLLVLAILPADIIGLPDEESLPILIALTFSVGLNNMLIGANNGLERFSSIAMASLVMGVILISSIVLSIIFDAQNFPLLGYLAATVASIMVLLYGPIKELYHRSTIQSPDFNRSSAIAIFKYLAPMFMVTILANTGLWLAGRNLLEHEEGIKTFSEFALGLQWFGLASMARLMVAKAVMPRLTKSTFHRDTPTQEETKRTGIKLSLIGALFIMVFVILFHPFILAAYGSEFSDSRWPLMLMVAAAVVASPLTIINSKLIAEALYNNVLVVQAGGWLVLVAGAYWFKDFGATAISLVVIVSFSTSLCLGLYFNKKALRTTPT